MTLGRQNSLDVDDLMARSTFGNLLKAAQRAQRTMEKTGKALPSYVVVTEAGQTNFYEGALAANAAQIFAEDLGNTALVIQILGVVKKRVRPAADPAPTGEPPDGRTA